VAAAISRGWAGGCLVKPVAILVRLGAVILVLRGGPGVVDDLTRAAGVRTGITGLSTKQTTGMAHLTWSGWAIDTYFLIGGVIFTWLAIRQRQHRRSRARRAHVAPAAAGSARNRAPPHHFPSGQERAMNTSIGTHDNAMPKASAASVQPLSAVTTV
jgi:hypothetical protein